VAAAAVVALVRSLALGERLEHRIRDELPGWSCEGNIYWHSGLFSEVEHGAEEIGMLESERRLFWVRLQLNGQDRTIFVSTAHFTYQGHPLERETGQSPRVEQTRRAIAILERLVRPDEPAFFVGDLNDPIHPGRLLREAGYISCFAALGIPNPPTFPCYPTVNFEPGTFTSSQTIDWIVANQYARPMAAQVPHCYHGDMAASDHWPVLAVYEV
jgi:hypothetical protein